MKNICYVFCLSLIFSSCSWVHNNVPFMSVKAQEPQKKTLFEQKLDKAQFVDSGKIVNLKKLSAGGKLAIIPFKAGPGVTATEELDKASFRVIKGIVDSLQDNRPYFTIITEDEKQTADFVLYGYFISQKQPSKSGRWVGNKKLTLGVRGNLINPKTGETILVFNDEEFTLEKDKDFNYLGYLIGQDIGRFISSGVQP